MSDYNVLSEFYRNILNNMGFVVSEEGVCSHGGNKIILKDGNGDSIPLVLPTKEHVKSSEPMIKFHPLKEKKGFTLSAVNQTLIGKLNNTLNARTIYLVEKIHDLLINPEYKPGPKEALLLKALDYELTSESEKKLCAGLLTKIIRKADTRIHTLPFIKLSTHDGGSSKEVLKTGKITSPFLRELESLEKDKSKGDKIYDVKLSKKYQKPIKSMIEFIVGEEELIEIEVKNNLCPYFESIVECYSAITRRLDNFDAIFGGKIGGGSSDTKYDYKFMESMFKDKLDDTIALSKLLDDQKGNAGKPLPVRLTDRPIVVDEGNTAPQPQEKVKEQPAIQTQPSSPTQPKPVDNIEDGWLAFVNGMNNSNQFQNQQQQPQATPWAQQPQRELTYLEKLMGATSSQQQPQQQSLFGGLV